MWKYSIIKLLRLRKIPITGMAIIIMSIPHISITSNTIIPMLHGGFIKIPKNGNSLKVAQIADSVNSKLIS